MSNLSNTINDNQAHLKGAVFHFKTYAIILFVLGGLMCLLGLPLLLVFGLGLIYIAIGVLYIFLGLNLLNASKSVKNIIGGTEITQDDYNVNSMTAIVELKKHFKIQNIIIAVSLGLSLIAGIAFAAFIPSLIKQLEKSNTGMMGTSPVYQPNPKNLSASQMGMSDKEHSELHDPKNIINTDYSTLDYGSDDKVSQDAVKKTMEAMTPEQKAAMEKLMSEIKN